VCVCVCVKLIDLECLEQHPFFIYFYFFECIFMCVCVCGIVDVLSGDWTFSQGTRVFGRQ